MKRGSLSRSEWQSFLDTLNSKLALWKSKLLSVGGRLVLLKSVLSSIPLYYMSFFKLPSWLIKNIDKIRRNFLSGGSSSSFKGKPPVKWEIACSPKVCGGLGVLNLQLFNISILSKWLWKFFDNIQILERYPFLLSTLLRLCPIESGIFSIASQGRVQGGRWIWKPIIRRPKNDQDRDQVQALLSLLGECNLSPSPTADSPSWSLSTSNQFSVKSLYSMLADGGLRFQYNSLIWNKLLLSKVQIIFWLLSLHRLKTKDRLVSQGWLANSSCTFWNEEETHDHLFLQCSHAQQLWSPVLHKIGIGYLPPSINQCLAICSDMSIQPSVCLLWGICFPTMCWVTWTARNNRIFSNQTLTPQQIIYKAIKFLILWSSASSSKKLTKMKHIILSSGLPDILESSVDSNGIP
ncbi:uncharacterized protein LOC109847395 [Asparagus officinalis]|uniref:uncharacterized protein LOC109847395 n=1 Tax=Asparagus officinalis TaxID=4686 RepID=UPI00098E3D7C|nr:uncharacterized protein LOC109847395 [Asparagus officinalis]